MPYNLRYRPLGGSEGGATLRPGGCQLPHQFMAVGVEILPIEDDEIEDYDVEMVPIRGGVLGVDRGLEEEHLIFYGVNAGATGVDVYFDEELVLEVQAIVNEQD